MHAKKGSNINSNDDATLCLSLSFFPFGRLARREQPLNSASLLSCPHDRIAGEMNAKGAREIMTSRASGQSFEHCHIWVDNHASETPGDPC